MVESARLRTGAVRSALLKYAAVKVPAVSSRRCSNGSIQSGNGDVATATSIDAPGRRPGTQRRWTRRLGRVKAMRSSQCGVNLSDSWRTRTRDRTTAPPPNDRARRWDYELLQAAVRFNRKIPDLM